VRSEESGLRRRKTPVGEILKMTAFLVGVCAVSAVALAFTNAKTKPLIDEQNRLKEERARREVLPGAEKFEAIDKVYLKGFDASGNLLGYVGKADAKGFGGAVAVMAGVDVEGKVTGVKVLKHQETPGLGTNATNPEGPVIRSIVGKGTSVLYLKKDRPDGEVDAITGVTITSRAVCDGVRGIVKDLEKVLKE
ncbi:MAG: RnfABCDGE type electron transport complex subunit G, partial [Planctomycetota bacterium]